MKFRSDINAMRALAVTLVVLHHFKIKGFSAGFVGVDLFFVLSGYLMTANIVEGLLAGKFSLLDFLSARAARIWPALLAMTMVLLALGALLLPPKDNHAMLRMAGGALFFYSNVLLSEANYFSTALDERWFLHTWSLSVEWQFYCLYPIYLQLGAWCIGKLFPDHRGKLTALAWLVAGLAVASFGWCVHLALNGESAFFSTSSRIWEMQIGGITFLLFKHFPQASPGLGSSGTELALKGLPVLLLAACMYLGRGGRWEELWPNTLTLIPVLVAALYIARPTQNRLLSLIENNGLVSRLGKWSYSIYLFHWPVVVGMNFYFMEQGGAPLAWRLSGIVASIALGFLSFTLVESQFKHRPNTPSPDVGRSDRLKLVGVLSLMFSVLLGSALFPGPVGATKDANLALSKDCENYRVQAADAKECFTHKGKGDVIVFGDSHAAHFYPWFKAKHKNSVTFFVANGCYPLFGVNRPEPGFDCIGIQKRFTEIIESGDYKVAIISGNWHRGDADDYVSASARRAAVMDTAAAFDNILGRGLKLIVVRATPFASFSMTNLQSRYIHWGKSPPSSFSDKAHAEAKGDRFLTDVQAAMKNGAALHFVDVRPLFCSDGICDLVDKAGNYPIFFDDNHFSQRWIIEHGDRIFSGLM